MNAHVEYARNRSMAGDIAAHLRKSSADFTPPLDARVEIAAYARRIAETANRFEAWADGTLVGLVAVYCGPEGGGSAFITNVSVLSDYRGLDIASRLIAACVAYTGRQGYRRVALEVDQDAVDALALYEKLGFLKASTKGRTVTMQLDNRK